MEPIARELRNLQIHASHRYAVSNRDYRNARTVQERLWLRFRMYFLYPIYFVFCELIRPSSVRVVCTNTFYVPFISSIIQSTESRSVHLLYDLFPDSLIVAEKIQATSVLARVSRSIVKRTILNSTANVALGPLLASYATGLARAGSPVRTIPVGTDFQALPSRISGRDYRRPIRVLYCGNLGHLHDVKTLEEAILSLSESTCYSVHFDFCGSGTGFKRLQRSLAQLPADLVSFEGPLESGEWSEKLGGAHVGLVTMKDGTQHVLYPSKTFSAMAAGQAIIAICPLNSDLADLIQENDCGWVIEPGDSMSLLELFSGLSQRVDEIEKKGANSLQAAKKKYDASPIALEWASLFKEIEVERCRVF